VEAWCDRIAERGVGYWLDEDAPGWSALRVALHGTPILPHVEVARRDPEGGVRLTADGEALLRACMVGELPPSGVRRDQVVTAVRLLQRAELAPHREHVAVRGGDASAPGVAWGGGRAREVPNVPNDAGRRKQKPPTDVDVLAFDRWLRGEVDGPPVEPVEPGPRDPGDA